MDPLPLLAPLHLASQLYFDSEATIIQRHWRGFWSRRNVFDFFARKVYLEAVASKNASIRRELNHEADRAMATQRQVSVIQISWDGFPGLSNDDWIHLIPLHQIGVKHEAEQPMATQ